MSDITFMCPHCSKSLVVDQAGAGGTVKCPDCRNPVAVPVQQAAPLPPPEKISAVAPGPAKSAFSISTVVISSVIASLVAVATSLYMTRPEGQPSSTRLAESLSASYRIAATQTLASYKEMLVKEKASLAEKYLALRPGATSTVYFIDSMTAEAEEIHREPDNVLYPYWTKCTVYGMGPGGEFIHLELVVRAKPDCSWQFRPAYMLKYDLEEAVKKRYER
jgi:hypothetical protein